MKKLLIVGALLAISVLVYGQDQNIRRAGGSGTVDDTAYDAATWNGNTTAPSKNAVRDKFESLVLDVDVSGLIPRIEVPCNLSGTEIDLSRTNLWFSKAISGNTTLTAVNPVAGRRFSLIVTNDGTSTLTFWTTTWLSGAAPVLDTGAGTVNVFSFYYDGAKYYGDVSQKTSDTLNALAALANGTGALTNNGSGGFGYFDLSTVQGKTNVTDFSATQAAFTNILASSVNTAAASIKISPRQSGSVMGSVSFESPESAVAGLARGSGAVDLQVGRDANTKIASGANAFTAGTNNTASQAYTIALGNSSTASAANAVAIGNLATASGASSVAMGQTTTASGGFSTALGQQSVASNYGELALSSGKIAVNGDAQTGINNLRAKMTIATSTVTNLLCAQTSSPLTLPLNTTWGFKLQVVGRCIDAGTLVEKTAFYTVDNGLIQRGSLASSTVLSAGTVTTVFETVPEWDCAISADTTNGALTITVTGKDETTIYWSATVIITQVTG